MSSVDLLCLTYFLLIHGPLFSVSILISQTAQFPHDYLSISQPVSSLPVSPYPTLSHPVLSYAIPSYPILSYPPFHFLLLFSYYIRRQDSWCSCEKHFGVRRNNAHGILHDEVRNTKIIFLNSVFVYRSHALVCII